MRSFPLLLLAAAPVLAQDRYPVAESEQLDVVLWFPNERLGDELARELLAVSELALAGAQSLYGLEDPLGRIVVNAYLRRRGADGFVEAVQALDDGAAEGVQSWHHWESRGVYVKLQPTAETPLLRELGFPPVTLRKAAEEVAHLVRLDAALGLGACPTWFADGSAAWVADEVMVAAGRAWPGTADPAVSTRVRVMRELRDAGRLPAIEDCLAGRAEGLDPEERVALDAVLVRFLAERLGPGGLAALAAQLLVGPPPEHVAQVVTAAAGLDDPGALEGELLRWLDAVEAPWRESFASLALHPEGWIQAAAEGRYALAWHEPPPAEEFVIRTEVELLRGDQGMGQINFALGRLPSGDYVSLSFNTSNGVLGWDYSAERDEFAALTPIALGTNILPRHRYGITVRVADGMVRGFIRDLEDEEALPNPMRPLAVEGREMTGPWGIGTIRSAGAIWRSIRVEPYVSKEEGD